MPFEASYFHYEGSLTVPPCTENVPWFVMIQPVRFAAGQIDRFMNVVKYNARPIQLQHSRLVKRSWK